MVYLHTAIKLFNVTVVNVTGELLSVGEKRLSFYVIETSSYVFDFLYSDRYNKYVFLKIIYKETNHMIRDGFIRVARVSTPEVKVWM